MTPDDRDALRVRVPTELKRRFEQYARDRGLTVNAALVVLIENELRRSDRRKP